MRPPAQDRIIGDATEIAIKDTIARFFDDSNLTKTGEYDTVDFIGDKYVYEIKTVQFPFGQHIFGLVTEYKIQQYLKKYDKDLYLVYKYSDGSIYYIKYNKQQFDRFKVRDVKRSDRIQTDKPINHIFIPVRSMKPIIEKQPVCMINFSV